LISWPRVDPFGCTANPSSYVPRESTEAALETLERRVAAGDPITVLCGPAGIGKTLLLRLLAGRLGATRKGIQLPYPALSAASLAAWALRLLGLGPGGEALTELVAESGRRRGRAGVGLVLLVDQAEALSPDAAADLAAAARSSKGSLQIVAATLPAGVAVLAEAWPEVVPIALDQPLTAPESRDYLCAHVGRASLPAETAAKFDAEVMTELHARARGIPRRLSAEASAFLRRDSLVKPRTVGWDAAPGLGAALRPQPHDAVFERALGKLALTHTLGGAAACRDTGPHLERAVGRLLLAERDGDGVGEPGAVEPPPQADSDPRVVEKSSDAPIERARSATKPPRRSSGGRTGRKARSGKKRGASSRKRVNRADRSGGRPRRPSLAAAPRDSTARTGSTGPAAGPRARVGWLRTLLLVLVSVAVGAVLASSLEGRAALEQTRSWVESLRNAGSVLGAAVSPAPPEAGQPPASAPVAVRVVANPPARISVDGEPVGLSPIDGLDLAPGAHQFEAVFPNGRRVVRRIEIDSSHPFVVLR